MPILTTHVGSLPGPSGFDPAASSDPEALRDAVNWVVEQQRAVGIDLINEGELTKRGDWLTFMDERLAGFEPHPAQETLVIMRRGRDREEFADFYRWAAERESLFFSGDSRVHVARRYQVCTAPIRYVGQAALELEIATLLAAVKDPKKCFLTSTAPASLEPYRSNQYYRKDEEFVFALAEALRVEYEAIAAAGLLVQIDDAWLVALWDRIGIEMGLEAFKARSIVRIEALNYALRNIPEERIRYHLCWGSWHGPHAHDIGMEDMVDVMLRVKARYYSFEAANVRHQHEVNVWNRVPLPSGKVLMPGVVTHSTDLIEHPKLVAERLRQFASHVGAENLIASTDCGFGLRTHPQIAWAKLRALCEGAALASRTLGQSAT